MESSMTTPDTDPKVKELLESTKELSRVVDELWAKPPGPYAYAVAHEAVVRANAALAAFDPPKPKQYTPAWEMRADALEKHIIQLQEQVMRLNDWQIKQNNAELRRQMLNQQPATAIKE